MFSPGESLEELEANLRDTYALVKDEQASFFVPQETQRKEIEVEV